MFKSQKVYFFSTYIGFIVLLIYSSNDTVVVRNNLLYMFAVAFLAEVLRFHNKKFNELYIKVLGFMMREKEKTERYNGVIFYLTGCICVLTLFPKVNYQKSFFCLCIYLYI